MVASIAQTQVALGYMFTANAKHHVGGHHGPNTKTGYVVLRDIPLDLGRGTPRLAPPPFRAGVGTFCSTKIKGCLIG
jgi:hypothetical protein